MVLYRNYRTTIYEGKKNKVDYQKLENVYLQWKILW